MQPCRTCSGVSRDSRRVGRREKCPVCSGTLLQPRLYYRLPVHRRDVQAERDLSRPPACQYWRCRSEVARIVRRAITRRGAQRERGVTACVLKVAQVEVTRGNLAGNDEGEKLHERWGRLSFLSDLTRKTRVTTSTEKSRYHNRTASSACDNIGSITRITTLDTSIWLLELHIEHRLKNLGYTARRQSIPSHLDHTAFRIAIKTLSPIKQQSLLSSPSTPLRFHRSLPLLPFLHHQQPPS